MAQTEFERGALWMAAAMKEQCVRNVIDASVPIPKQEPEAKK